MGEVMLDSDHNPNAVTSAVHDRMPVILDPRRATTCGSIPDDKRAAVSDLLKPYDARLMRCYPVSSRVNHVANDDEECSQPVESSRSESAILIAR